MDLQRRYFFFFLVLTIFIQACSEGLKSESKVGIETVNTCSQSPGSCAPAPSELEGSDEFQNTISGFSTTVCNDHIEVSSGTLCAIKPSDTDPEIKDLPEGVGIRKGFGYHVVGLPKKSNRKIWIHFVGTYGKPYNQGKKEFGTTLFANEILAQGYILIILAYPNEKSVNGHYCNVGSEASQTIDGCSEQVRQEVLYGDNQSKLIEVDPKNSIEGRLGALISFLNVHGGQLDLVWGRANLSGHSQGSGYAYYIAKHYEVEGACFLGGPYDTPDQIGFDPSGPKIADWFLKLGQATPSERLGGITVQNDINYVQFTTAYRVMGLELGTNWIEPPASLYSKINGEVIAPKEGEAFSDGHSAVMGAVELAADRAVVCFR